MLYPSADSYRNAERRSVFLFGMSGVGKTRVADILRDSGEWYHYSVDYRIGKRYLHDQINDTIKKPAMKDPVLRRLLRSDSITLRSNLAFKNLAPLSTYIGAPGNPDKGGLSFEEYTERQNEHRKAEIQATFDAKDFIERAHDIYEYPHFVCDSSGSVCEVADPEDPDDPVFADVAVCMLPVFLRAQATDKAALVRRFAHAPKPMCFSHEFLTRIWEEYRDGRDESAIEPNEFLVFAFERLLDWRAPRYQALADRWGITLDADAIKDIESAAQFDELVATALDARSGT